VSLGRPIESVADDVMRRLERYRWPGNVRELENVIERAVILTHGASLQLDQSFDEGNVGHTAPPDTPDTRSTRLEDVERAHLVSVLEACGWRIKGRSNAAEQLGLHPSTLSHRLKKLGIARPPS
jgi:transcriptional regulator of acetoin/glycerol metabolism